MVIPPAHPLACRIAGALLVGLSGCQGVFAPGFGGRAALSLALDPSGPAPWIAGGAIGAMAALLALAVAVASLVAGISLLASPEYGRFPGLFAALIWVPFGCGVVGLALLALLAIPGEARPPPPTPPAEPA